MSTVFRLKPFQRSQFPYLSVNNVWLQHFQKIYLGYIFVPFIVFFVSGFFWDFWMCKFSFHQIQKSYIIISSNKFSDLISYILLQANDNYLKWLYVSPNPCLQNSLFLVCLCFLLDNFIFSSSSNFPFALIIIWSNTICCIYYHVLCAIQF